MKDYCWKFVVVSLLMVLLSNVFAQEVKRKRGIKIYELSNQLNNVLVTTSDRKMPVDNIGDGVIDYCHTDIISGQDYFAFGMLMPLRSTRDFRFGFQGQEEDDEVKGVGNSINYKFRMHDPRLGRFFAVDPLFRKYVHNSVYAFSENRLLDRLELEGLECTKLTSVKFAVTPILRRSDSRIILVETDNTSTGYTYGSTINFKGISLPEDAVLEGGVISFEIDIKFKANDLEFMESKNTIVEKLKGASEFVESIPEGAEFKLSVEGTTVFDWPDPSLEEKINQLNIKGTKANLNDINPDNTGSSLELADTRAAVIPIPIII